MSDTAGTGAAREMVLTPGPITRTGWVASVWRARTVLFTLARADFHVRYKRAAFGVAWAVALPVLQASVLVIVFSRIVRLGGASKDFAAYVLSGVLAWSYLAQTIGSASTAIVDGAGLTDKVWFPRAILPLSAVLANLPGLIASVLVLLAALPLVGASFGFQVLLLPLAVAALFAFTASLGLVLSAMHVYFRDVRFIVQAGLMLAFWVTPIAYPKELLGGLTGWLAVNPVTGMVTLFRMATIGHQADWARPVAVTAVSIVVLLILAVEVHRRHDRLFVDQL